MIALNLALLPVSDIVDKPTAPLVGSSSGSLDEHAVGRVNNPGRGGWPLLHLSASESVWPRISWTADDYRVALTALADTHAAWWGRPPDPSAYSWVWSPIGAHSYDMVREARSALLEIGSSPWGDKFLPKERLRAWLRVLDDPSCLLDVLDGMPHTLIHGDYWSDKLAIYPNHPNPFVWRPLGAGPAPYDLACFHSLARWRFGSVPLSLVEMRNHYLTCLNERLGQNIDRYAFDLGMDAARAWRFAIAWPLIIAEHHATLLATLHRLQNAIIEPAFASLRRCV